MESHNERSASSGTGSEPKQNKIKNLRKCVMLQETLKIITNNKKKYIEESKCHINWDNHSIHIYHIFVKTRWNNYVYERIWIVQITNVCIFVLI